MKQEWGKKAETKEWAIASPSIAKMKIEKNETPKAENDKLYDKSKTEKRERVDMHIEFEEDTKGGNSPLDKDESNAEIFLKEDAKMQTSQKKESISNKKKKIGEQ